MSTPQYPHVKVQLTGADGNAIAIVARTRRALLDAGVPREEIVDFIDEATSGDYDHLLATVMDTVTAK